MKTYYLSAGAVFGALAAVIRVMNIKFPFPPIPYLEFELAEIPIITSFLLYGLQAGLIAVLSYYLILNVLGSWVPIGPAMALAASFSTIFGMWAAVEAFKKFLKNEDALVLSSVFVGMAFRIAVMSGFNYIILCWLLPSFLDYAVTSLSTFLKINLVAGSSALFLIFLFTAVFNAIQVIIITVPSILVVKAVGSRLKNRPFIRRVLDGKR
ncbi:MAG: hypothetical protein ACUVQ8_08490 [Nitrososphaeria archaeon]